MGNIHPFQLTTLPHFNVDNVRQNEYLSALHDTTLGVIGRLELTDLMGDLVARAGQLSGAHHGFIYWLDPNGEELECKVGVGRMSSIVGLRLRRGEGLAGKVWQNGEPLVIDDYDAWEGRSETVGRHLVRAMIGMPLKSGMTLAIEPMVNAGGWMTRVSHDKWTVVTADGSLSAHFEHTIAITGGDAEILTKAG